LTAASTDWGSDGALVSQRLVISLFSGAMLAFIPPAISSADLPVLIGQAGREIKGKLGFSPF
jgi:hypothetical protein